jgi:hypothetical protein
MNTNQIYFFISYTRRAKENPNEIDFVEPKEKDLKPECIYTYEDYKEQIYYYKKVYKVSKSVGKGKKNNYYFEFEIKDEKYVISFEAKESTFIYKVSLEVWKSILDIRKTLPQNEEYYEIIEYFVKALEKIGNESLIDFLYKETIALYKKKKGFSFLILLFLKIYKKKDLCKELLENFKEINENPKENEKNMNRDSILKDYTSKFEEIISEKDIIENYDRIQFYGIMLSYLNYYDYENFALVSQKLFENSPEDLYEILLIYKDNFKFPIKQNLDFFKKFISYIINKDEKKVQKKEEKKEDKKVEKKNNLERGLNYIKDFETFLNVIEEKKEDIFKRYNSKKIEKIIKLDDLKFKKIVTEDEEDDEPPTKGPSGNVYSIKTTETEKQDTEGNTPLKKKEEEKKRIEELYYYKKKSSP